MKRSNVILRVVAESTKHRFPGFCDYAQNDKELGRGKSMSTEWYLQAHSYGDEQFIPFAKIQSAFSTYPTGTETTCLTVTLPEGDVDFYMDLSDEISSLMISRPIESNSLSRIIYEIMQSGRFIFFATDANFPIILHPEVIEHLPEGMLDALGEPKVADSPEVFSRLLQEMYE